MSTRRFLAAFLVVALMVAVGASYYASSHPDGLEFVASQSGFLDRAEDSSAEESPLAGYSTRGIDDARVSGGVAGVAGCLLVLGISFGLFRVLRRRTAESAEPEQGAATTSGS
jgi:hypothetical protein